MRCRTGSLEINGNSKRLVINVRCRTGSLEIKSPWLPQVTIVRCRTGSLENSLPFLTARGLSALPHRQLRNPLHNMF